jgi:hypothetical protein
MAWNLKPCCRRRLMYLCVFLALAGLVCSILWLSGVFDSNGHVTIRSTDLTTSGRWYRKNESKNVSEWPSITEQIRTAMNLGQGEYFMVENTWPTCTEDNSTNDCRHFEYYGPYFGEDGTVYNIFGRRGENDIKAKLKRITGEFYGLYLQFETDVWSEGFQMDGDMTAELADMISKAPQAIPIIGPPPGNKTPEKTYKFDTSNPKIYSMNALSKNDRDKLVAVSDGKLGGTLRLAAKSARYHVDMGDGKEKVIQVIMNDKHGYMGDKTLYEDGKTIYIDFTNSTTSETRPVSDCLSFFTNRLALDSLFELGDFTLTNEEKSEERQQETVASDFTDAFRNNMLGMPVPMLNEIDFKTLSSETTLTVDFKTAPYVSFRDATTLGLTLADIAEDPVKFAALYDMKGIAINAEVSIV